MYHNPNSIGFILALLLIGTFFFGMCASAGSNENFSENMTNLSVLGNPNGNESLVNFTVQDTIFVVTPASEPTPTISPTPELTEILTPVPTPTFTSTPELTSTPEITPITTPTQNQTITLQIPPNSTSISLIQQEDLLPNSNDSIRFQQLEQISSQKESLTPPEKKLSTDLIHLIKPELLPPLYNTLDLKTSMIADHQLLPSGTKLKTLDGVFDDLVYVYISLNPSYPTSVIDSHVTQVTNRDEENHLAVAWVEKSELIELASLDAVRSIRTVVPPITNTGSVTTEGDRIHKSENVRNLYGYRGSGIKVGIISDGVDHLADSQARGDLPGTVHVLRNTYGGDEGTAMLEIVHDIAPDAELYFHDCGSSHLDFNSAISDLVTAGCKIICDDISWPDAPFFEDGVVAQHVSNKLATNNIIYVSSAGNYADSHYQGTYYNDGTNFHDFSEGGSAQNDLYVSIPSGGGIEIVLEWNDQFGHSSNNYDLVLYSYPSYTLLDWSDNIQDGNGDPFEYISGTNIGSGTITGAVAINNYHGLAASRILEVFIYPSNDAWVYSANIKAPDSVFGHTAVEGVLSTGAIDAFDPGNDEIEDYSSRGPVTISYPSPQSRIKPDISGIDNVTVTGVGGFGSPFSGTSAAAPHIAAIAAQIWSAHPLFTPPQVKSALYSTAVDLGSAGKDTTFGYGRADALAFANLLEPPVANFTANIRSGTSPLTVEFTDTSTGFPTSWNWSFGDSNISLVQNPIFTYRIPGNYTVALNVTKAVSYNLTVRTGFINVTAVPPPPVANFSANITSGTVHLPVRFNDTSLGNPTTWNWSFGDGNYSTEKNPLHTFVFPGTFTVALNASNAYGSNTSVKTNYIRVYPLVADFTANPRIGFSPLKVQFTDTSTNSPASWLWDFGDGNTTDNTVQNPIHYYYNASGGIHRSYTISLIATNGFGDSTITKTNYLHIVIPSNMTYNEYYRCNTGSCSDNIGTGAFTIAIEDWRLGRLPSNFTNTLDTSVFTVLIEDWRLGRAVG